MCHHQQKVLGRRDYSDANGRHTESTTTNLKCTFTPALLCAVKWKPEAFPPFNLGFFLGVGRATNKQMHHFKGLLPGLSN